MDVTLTLDHIITREDLLTVYTTFCKCYRIPVDHEDAHLFLVAHYNKLDNYECIRQKPVLKAKFSGSRIADTVYTFSGYNKRLGKKQQESSYSEFIDSMRQYFKIDIP